MQRQAAGKAVKTVSVMFLIAFLAKILGQVREMMIAASYGTASSAAQAFAPASQIPSMLFEISLGTAVSTAFIPVFNEYMQKHGKNAAFAFSNKFISVISVLSCIVTGIGMFLAGLLIEITAPGLVEETKELAVLLLRIMFPMIIFTSISFSFVGILQSLGEFKIPSAISLISNLSVILYLAVFNRYFGILGLAVCVLIGWALQLIVLLPPLLKREWRPRLDVDFKNEGIRKCALLALPVLVSSWVVPLNNMVNMNLASGLYNGAGIVAVNYANKLYLIVAGVFSMALSNYIFPGISKLAVEKKYDELAETAASSVRVTLLVMVPLAILFVILANPIVKLIYERGEFDSFSTQITAGALMFYSIGIPFYGINEVLNKTFYGMQKPRIPLYASIASIVVNVGLSILLVRIWDIKGLSIAASCAVMVMSVILICFLNRTLPGFLKASWIEIGKIACSGAVMVAAAVLSYQLICRYLWPEGILNLFVICAAVSFIGAVCYLFVLLILRSRDLKGFLKLFCKGE